MRLVFKEEMTGGVVTHLSVPHTLAQHPRRPLLPHGPLYYNSLLHNILLTSSLSPCCLQMVEHRPADWCAE